MNQIQCLESNWTHQTNSFEDMPLKDALLRGIYSYGFERPSTIQEKGILPIIEGHDTIAQAQSGTGKTTTFLISTLQRLTEGLSQCEAIILSPTREQAQKAHSVLTQLGRYLQIRCQLSTEESEKQELSKGVNVVVGTPGSVLDMIEHKNIPTHHMKILVLDGANEMFSLGFMDQVQSIFKLLPEDIQCCVFSATLPTKILEISQEFMRDPVRILVETDELTLKGISQYYVPIGDTRFKNSVLLDLYVNLDISQSIIYVNMWRTVEELTEMLVENSFEVSCIHGQTESSEQTKIMRDFRSGSTRVLVTDLVGRGIDVALVRLAINYDMPDNFECYLRRIGRSGRFGKKVVAINFMTPKDVEFLALLEDHYSTQIEELPSDLDDVF